MRDRPYVCGPRSRSPSMMADLPSPFVVRPMSIQTRASCSPRPSTPGAVSAVSTSTVPASTSAPSMSSVGCSTEPSYFADKRPRVIGVSCVPRPTNTMPMCLPPTSSIMLLAVPTTASSRSTLAPTSGISRQQGPIQFLRVPGQRPVLSSPSNQMFTVTRNAPPGPGPPRATVHQSYVPVTYIRSPAPSVSSSPLTSPGSVLPNPGIRVRAARASGPTPVKIMKPTGAVSPGQVLPVSSALGRVYVNGGNMYVLQPSPRPVMASSVGYNVPASSCIQCPVPDPPLRHCSPPAGSVQPIAGPSTILTSPSPKTTSVDKGCQSTLKYTPKRKLKKVRGKQMKPSKPGPPAAPSVLSHTISTLTNGIGTSVSTAVRMFPTITNVLSEAKDPLAAVTSVLQANNSSITVMPVPDEPKSIVPRDPPPAQVPRQFQQFFTPPKERPKVGVAVPAAVSQSVIYQPIFPRSTGDGSSILPPPPLPKIVPIVPPAPLQRVSSPVSRPPPSSRVVTPTKTDPVQPVLQNGRVTPVEHREALTAERPQKAGTMFPNIGPDVDPFDELLKSTTVPKEKPRCVNTKPSPLVSSSIEPEPCDSSVKANAQETDACELVAERGRKLKKRELSPSDFLRVVKQKGAEVCGESVLPVGVKQLLDFRLAMRLDGQDASKNRRRGTIDAESDDSCAARQNFWFHATSFVPLRPEKVGSRTRSNPAAASSLSSEEEESPVDVRRRLLSSVKRNLRAQNRQLKEAIRSQAFNAGSWQTRFANTLLSTAKGFPNKTNFLNGVFPKKAAKVKALSKRKTFVSKKCRYVEERGLDCDPEPCMEPSLPLTNYCRLHIVHSPEQCLFDKCEALYALHSCDKPAILTWNDLALCEEHMFPKAAPEPPKCPSVPSATKKPRKRSRNIPFTGRKRRRKQGASKGKCAPLKPPPSPPTPPRRRSPSPVGDLKNGDLEPPFIADPSLILSELPDPDHLLDGADFSDVLCRMIPDEALTDFFNDANGVSQLDATLDETKAFEEVLQASGIDVRTFGQEDMEAVQILDKIVDFQRPEVSSSTSTPSCSTSSPMHDGSATPRSIPEFCHEGEPVSAGFQGNSGGFPVTCASPRFVDGIDCLPPPPAYPGSSRFTFEPVALPASPGSTPKKSTSPLMQVSYVVPRRPSSTDHAYSSQSHGYCHSSYSSPSPSSCSSPPIHVPASGSPFAAVGYDSSSWLHPPSLPSTSKGGEFVLEPQPRVIGGTGVEPVPVAPAVSGS